MPRTRNTRQQSNQYEVKKQNIEVTLLSELMIKYYGNQVAVADLIGVHRATLANYLKDGDLLLAKHGDKWVPVSTVLQRVNPAFVSCKELFDVASTGTPNV